MADKDYNFACIGYVHPSEYPWEEQFIEAKRLLEKHPALSWMKMDTGKVLGLCVYIKELEKILAGHGLSYEEEKDV